MLELRRATPDDATAAAELLGAREEHDWGERTFTADELRAWWAAEPAAKRWLAWLDGRCAGYAHLFDDDAELAEIHDESCTHPELEGRGVATALFERLEGIASDAAFRGIRATAWTDAGRAFLAGRGYRLVEPFWRMEAELGATAPPEPPEGYRLEGYRKHEDDAELYACAKTTDTSWVGGASLELWQRQRHARPDYDPRGWAVARLGEEVAGAALGFPLDGRAWILDVFVSPEHRGRGLGLALMRDCFRRLREVGCTRAGLEVEAENAVRLYERAGMRVTRRYDVHEKAL